MHEVLASFSAVQRINIGSLVITKTQRQCKMLIIEQLVCAVRLEVVREGIWDPYVFSAQSSGNLKHQVKGERFICSEEKPEH